MLAWGVFVFAVFIDLTNQQGEKVFVLAKLIKALHSDAGPWSLAFGIMLGMIFGLTPLVNLHNLLVLFLVLFLRVNIATFLLSWGVFSVLAIMLDPIMNSMGEAILTHQGLQDTWTSLYNTSVGKMSQFYNTLTMGSITLSLILSPLVVLLSKLLIIRYREHLLARIERWKIIEVLKGSRVYQIYQRMEGE